MIGGRLTTLDHFLHGKDNIVLTGVDTYSGYGFVFSAHDASAKTTIGGLRESILISEDLQLGITDEREYAVGLGKVGGTNLTGPVHRIPISYFKAQNKHDSFL